MSMAQVGGIRQPIGSVIPGHGTSPSKQGGGGQKFAHLWVPISTEINNGIIFLIQAEF